MIMAATGDNQKITEDRANYKEMESATSKITRDRANKKDSRNRENYKLSERDNKYKETL